MDRRGELRQADQRPVMVEGSAEYLSVYVNGLCGPDSSVPAAGSDCKREDKRPEFLQDPHISPEYNKYGYYRYRLLLYVFILQRYYHWHTA